MPTSRSGGGNRPPSGRAIGGPTWPRTAKTANDGSGRAADVFETQEELEEFLTWLHADRAAGTV